MKEMYKNEYEDLILAMELFSEGHEVDPLLLFPVFDKDYNGHVVRNLGRGVKVQAPYVEGRRICRNAVIRFDNVTSKYNVILGYVNNDFYKSVETNSSDVAYETMYNWIIKNIKPDAA